MTNYQQHVKDFYNNRTAYDSEKGSQHPREAKLLIEFVPLQPGQKILDIATGTGLVAIDAAQKVGSQGYVIGIDMSSGMLSQARQKIAAQKLTNIKLVDANIEKTDFANESFDIIFCCSAIVLLTDIATSFKKAYRWLKPGGFIAFTCPPQTAYLSSVYKSIATKVFNISLPHILEPLGTPQKCQKLLQQAGFQNIEIKVESSGRYRDFSTHKLSVRDINLSFKGHPLVQEISTEKLQQLQTEYEAEIADLTTDQGIWVDTTTFFVRAQK